MLLFTLTPVIHPQKQKKKFFQPSDQEPNTEMPWKWNYFPQNKAFLIVYWSSRTLTEPGPKLTRVMKAKKIKIFQPTYAVYRRALPVCLNFLNERTLKKIKKKKKCCYSKDETLLIIKCMFCFQWLGLNISDGFVFVRKGNKRHQWR